MSDLLKLSQWLSPAFPLGSFAYSHGLEWAISREEVSDRDSLCEWLSDVLQFGAGHNDAILLSLALRGGDVAELAEIARAMAASRERLEETLAQGRAFAATLAAMDIVLEDDLPFPVAFGAAARGLQVEATDVIGLCLHAFVSNLVSAAVRFVPLGQNDGQWVLANLHDEIDGLAMKAATASLDDLRSFAVRGDLAAMHHETMDVRIFKT